MLIWGWFGGDSILVACKGLQHKRSLFKVSKKNELIKYSLDELNFICIDKVVARIQGQFI